MQTNNVSDRLCYQIGLSTTEPMINIKADYHPTSFLIETRKRWIVNKCKITSVNASKSPSKTITHSYMCYKAHYSALSTDSC